MHSTHRFVLLLLLVMFPCVRSLSQEGPVIGRAGNQYISEEEFIGRYELTPDLYRHRKSQTELNKAEFLYSMIAEKLLAQEASARHLDADSVFRDSYREITKRIARDRLYMKEVRERVSVSPEELRTGIAEATKELLIQFLFFDDEKGAEFVRSRIRTGDDFDRMRIDSSLGAVSDTATVQWGDADTAIQNAAYRLKLHEVSPVVKASTGYYILKLSRSRMNPAFLNLPAETVRERVLTTLRRKKERTEALLYMNRLLKGKTAYSPPALFTTFSDKMLSLLNRHRGDQQNSLTVEMVSELIDSCRNILSDSLIITGSRTWTVREIIGRLYIKSFPTTFRTSKQVGNALYSEFQEWADQELLEQEALRRGIDKEPDVQSQLLPWRDRYLADLMKMYIGRTVKATEADIYEYMRFSDSSTAVPMVQIRELHTSSLDGMRMALADFNKGIPFRMVVERYSSSSVEKQRGGLSDLFPITSRKPVGEIAWGLEIGQMYGPLEDAGGYLLFELVSKKDVKNPADTSAALKFRQAKENYLRHKTSRTITLFLAQTAAKRGYDVYLDRLKMVDVTTTPMMTYRFLGFGGRMFAVPFVDKQIQWLDEEPPAEILVP